ncbi:hypothetical protein I316_05737 [Kwoniella heveanensis BCC8398]|uniref:Uncharacterized protein n=1 Tax=Kwoniella heveanensis BCC8398 TaxID=1296120 RepID=A0A1B9GNH6_9TREE|nr:hypothetical protein I316_05737 [Kwoniella heveanensis BCC8398]
MAESSTGADTSPAGPSRTQSHVPSPGGEETTDQTDQRSYLPGDDIEYTVHGQRRTSPSQGDRTNDPPDTSDTSGPRDRFRNLYRSWRGRRQKSTERTGGEGTKAKVTFDDIADTDSALRDRISSPPRGRSGSRGDTVVDTEAETGPAGTDTTNEGDRATRGTEGSASGPEGLTDEERVRAYQERRRRAMETEGANPEEIEPHPLSSAWRHWSPQPRRLGKSPPTQHQAYVSEEEDEARATVNGTGTGPAQTEATASGGGGSAAAPVTEPISVTDTEAEAQQSTGGGFRGFVRKAYDMFTGGGDDTTDKLTKPAPTTTVTGRPKRPHVWEYFPGGTIPNLLEVGTAALAAQSAIGWNTGVATNPYASLLGNSVYGDQLTGLNDLPLWRLQQIAGMTPQSQYPSLGAPSNPFSDQPSAFNAFQNRFTTPQASAGTSTMTEEQRTLLSVSNEPRVLRLPDGTVIDVAPGEVPLHKLNAVRSQMSTAPQTTSVNLSARDRAIISEFAARTGQTFDQAAADLLGT